MQTVIIVIHLMVVLAMIGLVLLQKSEGGGLGMGGGSGFMTTRGSGNVLTRTTWILAGTFFATSLILSILAGIERRPASLIVPGSPVQAPGGTQAPGAPAAPGGSLLDQFQQPSAPATPPGPQVPQAPRSQ